MVLNSLKKLSRETARLPWCSMGSAFNCIIPYKFIMKRKTFRNRQNTVGDAIWMTSKHTETCFQFEPEASVPNSLEKKKKERKKSSNWKLMQLLLDPGSSEEFLWLVIWNRKKLDLSLIFSTPVKCLRHYCYNNIIFQATKMIIFFSVLDLIFLSFWSVLRACSRTNENSLYLQ